MARLTSSDLRAICERRDLADLQDLARDIGLPQAKIPAKLSPQEMAGIMRDWVDLQGMIEVNDAVFAKWAPPTKSAVLGGWQPVQIFLSGTSDLNPYKRKALQVAEYYGVNAWMDTDYRGAGQPRQVCLAQVRQSEKFFLFLGGRYGEVVDGLGISPTEDEYEQARAAGKSIYVFVERVPVREERQIAFLERVRSYSAGHWRWTFKTVDEIGALVREILETERRPAAGEA